MIDIIWISLNPVTKELTPFTRSNAILIEKKFVEYQRCNEEEKFQEENNSIFLGSNCFNATIRFNDISNIKKYICRQTTPGQFGGPRGGGKGPGERSVLRLEVPENNKVTIELKNITEYINANQRWRLCNDDNFNEQIEYQIPEEYIIQSNNLTNLNLEVWESIDLENLDEDFSKKERIVWQWCKGNQGEQGNLFALGDNWWLPYSFSDNKVIEEGISRGCEEVSIIPSDKIPRKIYLKKDNSFGKQIRYENGIAVGFRLVRRKIMTIKQLQDIFKKMKETPVDLSSLIDSLQNDEIPNDFCCPISQTLMKEPVKTSDHFTYDRTSIERWFSYGNITSPLTNLPLSNKNLIPNVQLKELIDEFLSDKYKLLIPNKKTSEAIHIS